MCVSVWGERGVGEVMFVRTRLNISIEIRCRTQTPAMRQRWKHCFGGAHRGWGLDSTTLFFCCVVLLFVVHSRPFAIHPGMQAAH